jgi:hypothetical protein
MREAATKCKASSQFGRFTFLLRVSARYYSFFAQRLQAKAVMAESWLSADCIFWDDFSETSVAQTLASLKYFSIFLRKIVQVSELFA